MMLSFLLAAKKKLINQGLLKKDKSNTKLLKKLGKLQLSLLIKKKIKLCYY